MIVEESPAQAAPADEKKQKTSFFRDSGWLMFANFAMGGLMWCVHFFSKVIPEKEYAVLGSLLALTMIVPVGPLQLLIAQQTASALAAGRVRQLAGLFRMTWTCVTLIWLVAAVVLLLFQNQLIAKWGLVNPAGLWVTLLVLLATAWLPLFFGLLQGRQDFLTFGWMMILNGVGRIGAAAIIVLVFAGQAAGIMAGTLAGLCVALGLGIWATRSLWSGPTEAFDRRTFLAQAIPLVIGFGSCQFLMAADTMVVNAFLKENSQCYVAAGTLSRALVWAVGPLAAVLFPRIVQSAVKSEKNNLFGVTLATTAVLAILGAVVLCVSGPLIVRIVSKPSYVGVTTQLLPWYSGAMVPLCLANLLISTLLGRLDFRVVAPVAALAGAYGVTLLFIHDSFIQVLQLLGAFNLALLAVCAWFAFRKSESTAVSLRS